MTISVIIISLLKRKGLKRCVEAVRNQSRPPDELIVVSPYKYSLPVKFVKIKSSNNIRDAINKGIKNSAGDILVFTEDDTEAYSDWLERIENAYKSDLSLGAIGGRDVIIRDGTPEKSIVVRDVGRLNLWRIVGNHHRYVKNRLDVDFLKGCNMSVKKSLFRPIDKNVKGFYRWEQDICLNVKKEGGKIVFDPEIKIKHFKGEEKITPETFFIREHNTIYLLLKYYSGFRVGIYFLLSTLFGDRGTPGGLSTLFYLFRTSDARNLDYFLASIIGKLYGIRTFIRREEL